MTISSKTLLASALVTMLAGGAAMTASAADLRPADIVKMANDGAIKPFAELDKIALDLHPGGTIIDADIDNKYGRVVYDLEVRDANGAEWDIHLDAKTGEVINNKRD